MKRVRTILRPLGLITSIAFGTTVAAQDWLGLPLSNFSGVNSMIHNPAEIADGRMIADIHLGGFGFAFDNNFVGIVEGGFFGLDAINGEFATYDEFKDMHLDDGFNTTADIFASNEKRIYLGGEILGPGFTAQLNDGSAFGLHTRFRNIINFDGFGPEAAKLGIEQLFFQPLWLANNPGGFQTDGMSIDAMHWLDIGGSYAREVPIMEDRQDHFFKAGGTLKLLLGYASLYMSGTDANYSFTNDDSLNISLSDFQYGHTPNYEVNPFNLFNSGTQGTGVGLDLGMVYEYRPDHEKYWVETAEGLVPKKDKNKYKVKVGLSILDIGGIKFDKDPASYDVLNIDTTNWDLTTIQINSIGTFDSLIGVTFPQAQVGDPSNSTTYRMGTPLSIAFNVDYMVNDIFYVNFGTFLNPHIPGNLNKVHGISNVNLTPRIESKWYDVGLPLSYTALGHFDVGLYLRGGPFYVGSPDFLRNAFGNNLKSLKLYMGIKVPIHQKSIPEPGDLDKDGVLDFADNCIDVPGPIENNGCPYGDVDQDGVMDNADECIDVAGPIENNGCPYGDVDQDGVLDNADECIDVAGPIENNGCPYGDKDNDGVLDNIDECIDLPGPAENGGCPYADADRDGVIDTEDECPLTPGPADNNGCPVLTEKEEEIIRLAFENLEFETAMAIIRTSSYDELDSLAALLVRKPAWGLRIAGHTDSDGSEQSNMILSKDRAEATKTYLQDKGVVPEKMIVEYYGESRPIVPNNSPANKQKNRRVEMTIVFE